MPRSHERDRLSLVRRIYEACSGAIRFWYLRRYPLTLISLALVSDSLASPTFKKQIRSNLPCHPVYSRHANHHCHISRANTVFRGLQDPTNLQKEAQRSLLRRPMQRSLCNTIAQSVGVWTFRKLFWFPSHTVLTK
jgi:hypothetical protein